MNNYAAKVAHELGTASSSNATLTVLLPPVFTLQATNRTVTAPANTFFYAAVKGTAPFRYQWLKDGVALADTGYISGSQSNVLTIAFVSAGDAGNYSLAATNAAGGSVSSNALLVVKVRSGGGDDGNEHDNVRHPASKAVSPAAKIAAVVVAPAAPVIAQIKVSGGNVTLDCTGTARESYTLQSSADLQSWKHISTNTASAQGVWSVTDTANRPQKFYRLLKN